MNADARGFADLRKTAAFSRVLAGLVEGGAVIAHSSLVPIAEYWPYRAWTSRVLELADGTFLSLPSGPQWRLWRNLAREAHAYESAVLSLMVTIWTKKFGSGSTKCSGF